MKQRLADEEILRAKVKKQREEIAKARKEQEERDAVSYIHIFSCICIILMPINNFYTG